MNTEIHDDNSIAMDTDNVSEFTKETGHTDFQLNEWNKVTS